MHRTEASPVDPTLPAPAGAEPPVQAHPSKDELNGPSPGMLIGDDLEIVGLLGRGGMGRVYHARDLRLGRSVAVKLVDPGASTADPVAWRAAFEAEARATARLAHPHVVTIHGAGEWRGQAYLVLELLRGESLAAYTGGRALAPATVARFARQLADALTAAHAAGVLHRDLKASNVWVQPDGALKVLDFGLATVGGEDPALRGGTSSALAPEQWRGDPESDRTDIWALGLLVYTLLTGAPPFSASNRREAVVNGPRPAPVTERVPDAPPALAELVTRALSRDPALRPSAPEALALARRAEAELAGLGGGDARPFRYLEPFSERESGWFFGREGEAFRLHEMVAARTLTIVAGPSGAGKTSLVRAGLIPRLMQGGAWRATLLRAGRDPLRALAAAFPEVGESAAELRRAPGWFGRALRREAASTGAPRLVVVDAAEELLTLEPDPANLAAFVAALCGAADSPSAPVRVVLTTREDYLSQVVALVQPQLADSPGLYVLAPPDRRALAQALEGPAARAGYRLEPGLRDAIVDGVAGAAAPLPLLQFAASRVWEARDEAARVLPLSALHAAGGVAGMLGAHAEQVLAALPEPGDVGRARTLLLALLTADGTRVQRTEAELLDGVGAAARRPVLDALVTGRLVVVRREEGEARLELAHEALVRGWSRLSAWLTEDRAARRLLEQVRAAAGHWDAAGRPDGLLWRDEALERARKLRDDPTLGPRDTAFLDAGWVTRDRARRTRRRLGAAGALAAATVLVASLAGTAAYRDRSEAALRAVEEAKLALHQAESHAQALASAEALHTSNQRALELAVEAVRSWPGVDAVDALRVAMHRPWVDRALVGHTAMVNTLRISPDGRLLLTSSRDHTARLWTLEGEPVATLTGAEGPLWGARFTPDGRHVYGWGGDNAVRLWGVDGGARGVVSQHTAPLAHAVASQAGFIASVGEDGLRIQPISGGPGRFVPEPATIVELRQDGLEILTESKEGVIRLYAPDGQLRRTLRGLAGYAPRAAYSPDGTAIVVWGGDDERASVLRVPLDGGSPEELRGHSAGPHSLAWAPSGSTFVTGSYDRTGRVWPGGRLGGTLIGHDGVITTISFPPDGQSILTGSDDWSARIWRMDGTPVTELRGLEGWARAVFHPDGAHVFTYGQEGTVRRWALDDGTLDALEDRRQEVALGRFRPGDPYPPTHPEDTAYMPLVLVNGSSYDHAQTPDRPPQRLTASVDGRRRVTLSTDRYARMWDAASGALVATLGGHTGQVWDAVARVDGGFLTVGSDGVHEWDADGRAVREIPRPGARSLAVGSDTVYIGTDAGAVVQVGGWSTQIGAAVTALATGPGGDVLAGGADGRVVRLGPDGVVRGETPGRGHAVERAGFVGEAGWATGFDAARLVGAHGEVLREEHVPDVLPIVEPWPDGSAILVALATGTLERWAPDGTVSARFTGHTASVTAARFTPDGQRLVTTSLDDTARVWSVDGALLATTPPERRPLLALAVAPDGRSFATGGLDGSVRLWSMSAEILGALVQHPRLVSLVAYTAAGDRVLSWSDDAAVHADGLDPAALLAEAEARLASIPEIPLERGFPGDWGTLR